MTHDPAATLGPLNAAHEMLDDADIVRGPIPSRVRAVLADLRHVRAERDALRAELDALRAARMDPDPAEAADVHLCNAIAAAHDGNLNLASSEATKALACLGLDSAFVATVSRAEKAPPPEPAESERVRWNGRHIYVNNELFGAARHLTTGSWEATMDTGRVSDLPDEATARAVLLALAGEDTGVTVALSLRASWTREDVDRARDAGLGDCAAPLLEGYAEGWDGAQHTKGGDVIRAWVAGGRGLMTLRVVEESADDCPF